MNRHGMIIAAMALLLCGFPGKLTQEHQPVIDYLNGHSKLPVVASTGPLPSPAPTIKALLECADSIIDGGTTFYFSLPQSSGKVGHDVNLQ